MAARNKKKKKKDEEKSEEKPVLMVCKCQGNEIVGGDSRFVIADYKGKVFFMLWQPETAKIKSKMTYSSVKDKFKSGLQGVSFQIQATDDGEMAKEVFDNFIAKSAV